MRRTTRHILTNLLLFHLVLLLILHSHIPRPQTPLFAWSTIRYTSPSPLPPSRGKCPSLRSTTKPALVVARTSAEDTAWLAPLTTKYHPCVYTVDALPDDPSHLSVPANAAHEATPYLTFLIDNHDALPAAGMVFIHASRFAWHNDHPAYDNLALLEALNLSAALQPAGYHNLRCAHAAGTCNPADARPQASLETRLRRVLEPWNRRVVSDVALADALGGIFGAAGPGPRRPAAPVRPTRHDAVRAQCCAQFAVSRRSALRHSREEYVALRQWILDGAGGTDDRVVGRVMSYLWHVLFVQAGRDGVSGEDSDGNLGSDGEEGGVDLARLNELACPDAGECYCRLYGLCGLDGCQRTRCAGRGMVPVGYRLPEWWEREHS